MITRWVFISSTDCSQLLPSFLPTWRSSPQDPVILPSPRRYWQNVPKSDTFNLLYSTAFEYKSPFSHLSLSSHCPHQIWSPLFLCLKYRLSYPHQHWPVHGPQVSHLRASQVTGLRGTQMFDVMQCCIAEQNSCRLRLKSFVQNTTNTTL